MRVNETDEDIGFIIPWADKEGHIKGNIKPIKKTYRKEGKNIKLIQGIVQVVVWGVVAVLNIVAFEYMTSEEFSFPNGSEYSDYFWAWISSIITLGTMATPFMPFITLCHVLEAKTEKGEDE